MSAYLKLEKKFSEITIVNEISSILSWDSQVIMPDGAHNQRTEQLCYLTGLVDKLLNSREIADLLEEAKQLKDLDNWQFANLKNMERQYRHEASVDKNLKEKFAAANANCEMIWRDARKNDDWHGFLPSFKEVVKLVKEIATVKSEVFGASKYDVLLDSYDPGRKSAEIDVIFSDLAKFLTEKIPVILENQKTDNIALSRNYPIEEQKLLGKLAMDKFGFDFKHGRLDESVHPFCSGTHQDVRMTSRYDEKDFLSGFFGIVHETGHGKYEQNLPTKWSYQPVGSALGMSVHESQSLLVEMQLCRSASFIKWLEKQVKQQFGDYPEHNAGNLNKLINHVERSLIRVEADEVTYPCHVILRYELEKKIINGELEVEDIADAWNERMKKLLQVTPKNNKDGCMQDIHWPMGYFGYFPCYTLGAIIAAQLFAKIKQDITNLDNKIMEGNFTDIFVWLRDNIQSKASSLTVDELLIESTGRKLDIENYKNYITSKYLG